MASKIKKIDEIPLDLSADADRERKDRNKIKTLPRDSMTQDEREGCFCELISSGILRILDR